MTMQIDKNKREQKKKQRYLVASDYAGEPERSPREERRYLPREDHDNKQQRVGVKRFCQSMKERCPKREPPKPLLHNREWQKGKGMMKRRVGKTSSNEKTAWNAAQLIGGNQKYRTSFKGGEKRKKTGSTRKWKIKKPWKENTAAKFKLRGWTNEEKRKISVKLGGGVAESIMIHIYVLLKGYKRKNHAHSRQGRKTGPTNTPNRGTSKQERAQAFWAAWTNYQALPTVISTQF